MKLFDLAVPEDNLHHNFREILRDVQLPDRTELERWCEGFPDRDNKFVKEFQTTFNSSFWEIYLYALFKEMNFELDWTHASPDFLIEQPNGRISIEATIASASNGKPNEWEKELGEAPPTRFREMNIESIIRLANAISSKRKKYKQFYSNLPHVKSNPFVLAVAPFEQPHFNIQYDTPIIAVLYDYYVDEDAWKDSLHLFPDGPPGISLGSVEKENGAEIELGFFNDESFSEISAVVFSTLATWGKVEAMSNNPLIQRYISSVWWTEEDQNPVQRTVSAREHTERVRDGLLVFHNPYAIHPIGLDVFDKEGVVQVFSDSNGRIMKRGKGNFLIHRQTINLISEAQVSPLSE